LLLVVVGLEKAKGETQLICNVQKLSTPRRFEPINNSVLAAHKAPRKHLSYY